MTVLTGPGQELPGPNPEQLLNQENGIMMTVLTDPDQERPRQERGIIMTALIDLGPDLPGPSPEQGTMVLKAQFPDPPNRNPPHR